MLDVNRARAVAPWIFVVLWSTGFVAARYATNDNGPLAFLTIRMLCAALLLSAAMVAGHQRRPNRRQMATSAIAGIGMNAMYLGGVFVAIGAGMSSALSALISGLHPVVTAVLAFALFGERLQRIQWWGVVLGFAGVVWFTANRMVGTEASLPTISLVAMGVSLAGMVYGTLVQRRYNGAVPLLGGTATQYFASAAVLGVGAVAFERQPLVGSVNFYGALIYAVVVLSVGAVLLMLWLLKQDAAAQVSSLFFLTPALSAVEAAFLFGQAIDVTSVAALAVSAVGVVLVMRPDLVKELRV